MRWLIGFRNFEKGWPTIGKTDSKQRGLGNGSVTKRAATHSISFFQDSIRVRIFHDTQQAQHLPFNHREKWILALLQTQGQTVSRIDMSKAGWCHLSRIACYLHDFKANCQKKNRPVACLEHSGRSRYAFYFWSHPSLCDFASVIIFALLLLFLVCCNVFHVSSGANRSTCSVWTTGHRCMVDLDGCTSKEMMPMLVWQSRCWLSWAWFKFETGREGRPQTTFCKQWFALRPTPRAVKKQILHAPILGQFHFMFLCNDAQRWHSQAQILQGSFLMVEAVVQIIHTHGMQYWKHYNWFDLIWYVKA